MPALDACGRHARPVRRSEDASCSTAAVFTEGGRTFAYVNTKERDFIRRSVETAPSDGELQVLSGLQAGEFVVSNGALMLRLQEDKQALN